MKNIKLLFLSIPVFLVSFLIQMIVAPSSNGKDEDFSFTSFDKAYADLPSGWTTTGGGDAGCQGAGCCAGSGS